MAELDAIGLEILSNALKSINDESFVALMKASYSTNIKERHDHSTAIMDAKGALIAQAEMSLPIHVASMSGLMRCVQEKYGDDIHAGDLFVANDPHTAGGTHLPDVNFAAPVFVDGKLIGFVCNIAHHADIGGMAAGSMSGGMTEIYQEGLRIPVTRLGQRDEINHEILDIFLLNARAPTERRGDYYAQIAAAKLGVRRMKELGARYGAQTLITGFDQLLERSATRMATALKAVPDGTYHFRDCMDDDGVDAVDIFFELQIDAKDGKLKFDFAGTDDQTPGNINMTLNATQAAVIYAVKALLDPNAPNTQSVIDCVEITAPVGSIANAIFPAPVAGRAHTCQRIIDVVMGALAPALPDRVPAAPNGANTMAVFSGVDPRSGESYVYLETIGGGAGGRPTKHGKDGVQTGITNTSNLPVEAIEMEYPLMVLEYGLAPDSGGAGLHRGGRGIRRIVKPVDHVCTFNGVGERFRNPPWGLNGGDAGGRGRFAMLGANGAETALPGKTGDRVIPENGSVLVDSPGAGGWGKA
ncbi:MAG: hydantoinase B/oxoprolinase family protein [Alphaproteobacteria bacterium]